MSKLTDKDLQNLINYLEGSNYSLKSGLSEIFDKKVDNANEEMDQEDFDNLYSYIDQCNGCSDWYDHYDLNYVNGEDLCYSCENYQKELKHEI